MVETSSLLKENSLIFAEKSHGSGKTELKIVGVNILLTPKPVFNLRKVHIKSV